MLPDISKLASRWLSGAQSAWPFFLIAVLVAVLIGYQLAAYRLQPLTPPFTFTNGTSTIEASGAWHGAHASTPNAAKIFCWFPVNSCQVTVAELIPDGFHNRLELNDTEFDIVQLSDATLTAMASSTDPCRTEILRIDRKDRHATLSVGPTNGSSACDAPLTATLGD
jgi:hypothetical protein